MKMELGIEIKFVFRMEIMFGLVYYCNKGQCDNRKT